MIFKNCMVYSQFLQDFIGLSPKKSNTNCSTEKLLVNIDLLIIYMGRIMPSDLVFFLRSALFSNSIFKHTKNGQQRVLPTIKCEKTLPFII